MDIGQKRFYCITASIITGDLDELATGPPRFGTSIAKTGVRLLDISERIAEKLA